jgi:hypothetical protein
LMWPRIGTGGGLLWMRLRTFGFHKMRGISWVVGDMLASQEGLYSMELVILVNKTCTNHVHKCLLVTPTRFGCHIQPSTGSASSILYRETEQGWMWQAKRIRVTTRHLAHVVGACIIY